MTQIKCLGCGINMDWIKGAGTLAYTCYCGATTFYGDAGQLMLPTSFLTGIAKGHDPAHIDYYIGKSAHTSPEKESFITMIKGLGAVWSWECDKCRDHTLQRCKMEQANKLYMLPFHPALQGLLDDVPIPEGYEPPGLI